MTYPIELTNFISTQCGKTKDKYGYWEPNNEETEKCNNFFIEKYEEWKNKKENQKKNNVYIENKAGRNALLAFAIIFIILLFYFIYSENELEGLAIGLIGLTMLIIWIFSKNKYKPKSHTEWIKQETKTLKNDGTFIG